MIEIRVERITLTDGSDVHDVWLDSTCIHARDFASAYRLAEAIEQAIAKHALDGTQRTHSASRLMPGQEYPAQ